MPLIVEDFKKRYYTRLPHYQNSFFVTFKNTTLAIFLFIFMFVVTLPLWLLPGMQVFIPLLLHAGLNRRLFTFDALSSFLSNVEINQFRKKYRAELLVLGLFAAFLSYIPILSLFSPLLGALSFAHFCLGRLQIDVTAPIV